jgi:threonine/homoserine/homoserine lactone efflux protein
MVAGGSSQVGRGDRWTIAGHSAALRQNDRTMGQAIGDLLPSAVGVAFSPVPIIAVILMLGTPKARTNGPAFAIGWVLGLVIVTTIIVLLAGGADDSDSGSSTAVDIIKLLFGALFLLLGVKQWQSRPKEGEEAEMPKWMSAIDQFTAAKSAGLGALLSSINPKNLALTFAAAAAIAQAGLSGGETTIAIAVFVIIGSVTVAGPVLYYLLAKDSEALLGEIKQFMSEHNAVIMFVLFMVLGAKLVGGGIAGLAD